MAKMTAPTDPMRRTVTHPSLAMRSSVRAPAEARAFIIGGGATGRGIVEMGQMRPTAALQLLPQPLLPLRSRRITTAPVRT